MYQYCIQHYGTSRNDLGPRVCKPLRPAVSATRDNAVKFFKKIPLLLLARVDYGTKCTRRCEACPPLLKDYPRIRCWALTDVIGSFDLLAQRTNNTETHPRRALFQLQLSQILIIRS